MPLLERAGFDEVVAVRRAWLGLGLGLGFLRLFRPDRLAGAAKPKPKLKPKPNPKPKPKPNPDPDQALVPVFAALLADKEVGTLTLTLTLNPKP